MLDPLHIWSGHAQKHWPEAGLMILAHQQTGSIWQRAWMCETGSGLVAFCHKQARWFLHTGLLMAGPDPFGQNLTQSDRTKLDLGWFCTIWSGPSVEECGPSLKVGNWYWAGSILPELGPVILAHQLASWMHFAKTWPGHLDWIRAGSAQYDVGLLWKNGIKSDAGSQIRHIYDPTWFGWMPAIIDLTGCNQSTSKSDPACLHGVLMKSDGRLEMKSVGYILKQNHQWQMNASWGEKPSVKEWESYLSKEDRDTDIKQFIILTVLDLMFSFSSLTRSNHTKGSKECLFKMTAHNVHIFGVSLLFK